MRIGMMRVRMTIIVVMIVALIVVVVVIVVMAVRVIIVAVAGEPRPDSLDVMVVALLNQAHLVLEPQHMLAVLTELAVHVVRPLEDFLHAVGEAIQNEGMIVEITRLDEFDIGVPGRHQIG